MPKVTLKRTSLLLIVLLSSVVLHPIATSAQSTERAQEVLERVQERLQDKKESSEVVQVREKVMESRHRSEEVEARITERREQRAGRLKEAKLKVCQNREEAIRNIMTRVSDRGIKQLAVFTKIADRVQTFYVEQGNSIDTYDTLVENMAAKKDAAETAVALVHGESDDFNCEGDDPKASADSFRQNVQAMNDALKEYKTAVKDLIVGVRSAQETITTENTENGGNE